MPLQARLLQIIAIIIKPDPLLDFGESDAGEGEEGARAVADHLFEDEGEEFGGEH